MQPVVPCSESMYSTICIHFLLKILSPVLKFHYVSRKIPFLFPWLLNFSQVERASVAEDGSRFSLSATILYQLGSHQTFFFQEGPKWAGLQREAISLKLAEHPLKLIHSDVCRMEVNLYQ